MASLSIGDEESRLSYKYHLRRAFVLRCDALTTGSRALDMVLGLGSASLVLVHGREGAGKSAVLRAAAVSYATSCGRSALISVGPWNHMSSLAGLPQATLDRLVLMRLVDEESLLAASRAISLIDFGLVALDDASYLSSISRSAAPQSLMALALSRAVYRRGIQAIVALSSGISRIRGYDYWWPFADIVVMLETSPDGVHRASSAWGDARFRIHGDSISDT
ncbi:MAG: hypothetical protein ACP5L2_03865 [Conexivisphaera sp.]|jgi:hypothetical protein